MLPNGGGLPELLKNSVTEYFKEIQFYYSQVHTATRIRREKKELHN